jgi:hypothetical protein
VACYGVETVRLAWWLVTASKLLLLLPIAISPFIAIVERSLYLDSRLKLKQPRLKTEDPRLQRSQALDFNRRSVFKTEVYSCTSEGVYSIPPVRGSLKLLRSKVSPIPPVTWLSGYLLFEEKSKTKSLLQVIGVLKA